MKTDKYIIRTKVTQYRQIMSETKILDINLLEFNKGQIEGLPKNPRMIRDARFDALKKSIQDAPEMLNLRELIVYPIKGQSKIKYVVICGNMRLKAMKDLNYMAIPCKILDEKTPPEKLREYAIKDNIAFGDDDWDSLAGEWDTEELLEWGVELPDVEEEETTEIEDVDVPENVETRCTKGDIWQLGNHRLMCGDSTDAEQVAKLMDGEKADLLLTDPPYGISVVSKGGTVGGENLCAAGTYSPVIGDETTETAQKAFEVGQSFSKKQIIFGGNYFVDFLPFSDSWLIWDKRGESGIRNNFADGEMAWCSFHTPIRIYHQLWAGMIKEGEHEKRVHPTQKPIRMLGDIMQDFSEQNNVVLDLFGGSGSTLIACEQTKRKCYIMEYDPHYCDIIIGRWEKLIGKTAQKLESNK